VLRDYQFLSILHTKRVMTIDFIYDADCPNVDAARENLAQALLNTRMPPTWTEWDRANDATPAKLRRFGSPTILINGSDIAGVAASASASCCRIYDGAAGAATGAPPVSLIEAALRIAAHPGS
jgi:mercuric ion transport protein